MTTIIEFLTARLDEDEEFAQQFLEGLPDEYVGDLLPVQVFALRMLREVTAKRRTLDRHRACGTGVGYCDDGGKGWEGDDGKPLCNDKLDLAAPYSDHPDYRAEWA